MIRRLAEQDFSGVPDKEAWVTDTVSHQAYLTLDYLKTRWTGEAYERNMDKLNRAVSETRGMVLTYEGKPINATFFSTGNGYTENSEDYWGVYVPYLRSVKSPWDEASPEYRSTAVLSLKEFASRLGLPSTVSAASAGNGFKVQGYTEGHRVSKATVAGRTFSGREIREKLGLRSSQFQWKVKGTNIEFTTFGYGHGVGMSQWGANAMAKEGRTAEEIVKYYYTGISLEKDSAYLTMK
ncbi:stage II sporulation protein D [Paenibacillus sp. CC-CFT747]|nr:stage II sporulation protein D [Paenibacillus sp. CC-CFT747]